MKLWVLIVAKCIVNIEILNDTGLLEFVLIVAKCIVNYYDVDKGINYKYVLIVAKCIVNWNINRITILI